MPAWSLGSGQTLYWWVATIATGDLRISRKYGDIGPEFSTEATFILRPYRRTVSTTRQQHTLDNLASTT